MSSSPQSASHAPQGEAGESGTSAPNEGLSGGNTMADDQQVVQERLPDGQDIPTQELQ